MNELVSVIITTYGRTTFLEAAIKSVVSQTYKNIEIIIVDDNALKQNVRKEVVNIVSKFPKCKLILNEKNLGGALARNEGINVAKGSFISFLDDDDTYALNRIEENIKAYETSIDKNVGIIYSYCNSIDAEGKIIGEYIIPLSDKPIFQHMMNCLCATSQWFIPKHVFNDVGTFEDTPCKQDSIMLLKILGAGYEVVCIPKKLSNYREHNSGRISGNNARNLIGWTNLRNWCRKYYSKLNGTEILQVECNYAKQLVYLNSVASNRLEALKNLRLLYKNRGRFMDLVKCLIFIILGENILKIKKA